MTSTTISIVRSPEGTAAKGMNIRGNEDLWVEIQANTFRNWVNEHLRDVDLQVSQQSLIESSSVARKLNIIKLRDLKVLRVKHHN